MSKKPDLPDPNTLRAVADDLDAATEAIDTLHLGDIDVNDAEKLHSLQGDLGYRASILRDTAKNADGGDE